MSAITLNDNMVLVELPIREELEAIAAHEGFDSIEEWVGHALLSHAQWIALRDKMDARASTITVAKLGLTGAA